MTDTPAVKLSASDLLIASVRMTWEHIWFLLIISLILSALYVAAVAPFFGMYIQLFGAAFSGQSNGLYDEPGALNAEFLEAMKWTWIFVPVTTLAMTAFVVLWIRRLALGHPHMFDGGVLIFLWRSILCVWRFICAYVLAIVVFAVSLLPVALLFGLIALLQDGGFLAAVVGLVVVFLVFILYVVASVGVLLVLVALLISLTATSLDYRLGIIKCARLLKGNWVAVTLAAAAIGLTVMVVSMLLFGAVMGWGATGGASEDGLSTGLIVFLLVAYTISVAIYGAFGALGVAAFGKLRPDAPNTAPA